MEYNSPSPEDRVRERELEARAYFKGFAEQLGLDLIDDVIGKSEERQNQGLRGVTMPSEDRRVFLLVEDGKVSFKADDWGPYNVPIDTAKIVIIELREEQKKQKNFWERFVRIITEDI